MLFLMISLPQTQHDKIKRKALLVPNAAPALAAGEDALNKRRSFASNAVDLGAVVGGMEACGVSDPHPLAIARR